MVLAAALAAAVRQFAAGHGHERPLGALDDLQVANDEGVVERDRAEGLEALVVVVHELDPDFGDDHSCSPFLSVAQAWGVPSSWRAVMTPRGGRGSSRPLRATANQVNGPSAFLRGSVA